MSCSFIPHGGIFFEILKQQPFSQCPNGGQLAADIKYASLPIAETHTSFPACLDIPIELLLFFLSPSKYFHQSSDIFLPIDLYLLGYFSCFLLRAYEMFSFSLTPSFLSLLPYTQQVSFNIKASETNFFIISSSSGSGLNSILRGFPTTVPPCSSIIL